MLLETGYSPEIKRLDTKVVPKLKMIFSAFAEISTLSFPSKRVTISARVLAGILTEKRRDGSTATALRESRAESVAVAVNFPPSARRLIAIKIGRVSLSSAAKDVWLTKDVTSAHERTKGFPAFSKSTWT